MAEIHLQDGETLESALRRFKRLVLREEIIKEIKRHSFYLKPGEKKRVKAALARKRNRKKRSRDAAAEPARYRPAVFFFTVIKRNASRINAPSCSSSTLDNSTPTHPPTPTYGGR